MRERHSERRNTAAKARQAMLEKFRAKPSPDDPAVIERQAARVDEGKNYEARRTQSSC